MRTTDEQVQRIPLTAIIVDRGINVRASLDEERVEYLREVLDQTPPIVVFETTDGALLSDGFHRYEAARREGRTDIHAELHVGTRKDALVHAAVANSTHGTPLTRQDFGRAVVRLHDLDPSLTAAHIGEMLGGAKASTVAYWMTADDTRRRLEMPELPTQHAFEISRAPEQDQRALARRAVHEGWHSRETRAAAQALAAPDVPEHHKRDLKDGTAVPLAFVAGEPRILPETHGRMTRDAKDQDRVGDLFRLAALVLGFALGDSGLEKVSVTERRRLADDLRAAGRKLDRLAQEIEATNLEAVR